MNLIRIRKIKKRVELDFYKTWLGPFMVNQLKPKFDLSKNVQGYFFVRNWSITWLTYCLNFSITLVSDTNEDQHIAHEKNVEKYMKTNKL